jgi:hypothetical protein
MTRRKPLLLLGILLAVAAGLGYLLLHREPVYGGKPRSYWRDRLVHTRRYAGPPPSGWLARQVWELNPWKPLTVYSMVPHDNCEASAELLVEMLSDPDPDFRHRAAFALSFNYSGAPEAADALVQAAGDSDPGVRRMTAENLARQVRWTPAMAEACLALRADSDLLVRESAYHSVGNPFQEEAVAAILEERAKMGTLALDGSWLLQHLQARIAARQKPQVSRRKPADYMRPFQGPPPAAGPGPAP